jgi:hypothetical protein
LINLNANWTGVEYWQHASPPSESTTVECNALGEDPACSASIPSRGLNVAHAMVCVFSDFITLGLRGGLVLWHSGHNAFLHMNW